MAGGYNGALMVVLGVAMLGALSIAVLPKHRPVGEGQ